MAENTSLPFPDAGLDSQIQTPEQQNTNRALRRAQRVTRSRTQASNLRSRTSSTDSRIHKTILPHRPKPTSNPWTPQTPIDLSKPMQLRSGRSFKIPNKPPRPVAKSSILDDKNRGLKDLEAALPQIQAPGRVTKAFRPGKRVRGVAVKKDPPFWISDLCILLSCVSKNPHVHTKHEVSSTLGWGRTSIELFNDHLALYRRLTNIHISTRQSDSQSQSQHSFPQPQPGGEEFESVETDTMDDLRWRPCSMLDEFGSGTVALRVSLPVVADIPESKSVKKGGGNEKSFEEACARSQTDMGRHNWFKGRPLIGPVRPERGRNFEGGGDGSFGAGISGDGDEMEGLDVEQGDGQLPGDCQPQ